jgi:hypothetical protein
MLGPVLLCITRSCLHIPATTCDMQLGCQSLSEFASGTCHNAVFPRGVSAIVERGKIGSHWVDIADSHGLQCQRQTFTNPMCMLAHGWSGQTGSMQAKWSPATHVRHLHWGRSSCELHDHSRLNA